MICLGQAFWARADSPVVAWGSFRYGFPNPSTYSPVTIPQELNDVVAVAAGVSHSLALTTNGMVYAWGNDEYGQSDAPMDYTVAIAAGGVQSLALTGPVAAPLLRLEVARGTSGLEMRAYGSPGISCQLLRAASVAGPWLPTQPFTFTNTVQPLRPPPASARFFRLSRR